MKNLKDWLDQNADHFKGYSAEEIERLAQAAGVQADYLVIRQWKTQQAFKEAI